MSPREFFVIGAETLSSENARTLANPNLESSGFMVYMQNFKPFVAMIPLN